MQITIDIDTSPDGLVTAIVTDDEAGRSELHELVGQHLDVLRIRDLEGRPLEIKSPIELLPIWRAREGFDCQMTLPGLGNVLAALTVRQILGEVPVVAGYRWLCRVHGLSDSAPLDHAGLSVLSQTVLDSSSDCIVILGLDARVILMNGPGMVAMELDSLTAVRGRPWLELWPPDSQPLVRGALETALQGQVSRFQGYCPTVLGTSKWWEVVVTPILGNSGRPIRIMSISRDITVQRNHEIDVRESELRFQSLADNMAQLAWMADAEGRTFWYNKRWLEFTGVTLDSLQGHNWERVYHPQHVERVLQGMQAAFRSGTDWEDTFPLKSVQGEYRWFLSRMTPIRDESGTILRWLGTSTDVTPQKELELELRQARQLAEVANRAKSDFLANMSHEIRSPMTAILGYAELLEAHEPAEQEKISTIRQNGQFLLALLNDILDLSKIEAGKMEVESVRFNPGELADEVSHLMGARAGESGLAFATRYLNPIPTLIATDPIRLRQILINLLGNAIKFTESGSVQLSVSYDREHEELRFEVTDTGRGIPSEQCRTLFQPFEQGDSSVARRFGGSGLGLAISSRLAKILGGRIEVESEVGKGSTFSLVLHHSVKSNDELIVHRPTVLHRSPQPGSLVQASPPRAGALPLRVLVVDDRRDILFVASQFLQKVGGEVLTAEDGASAVAVVQQESSASRPLDAILMDVQMPHMDGLTATRHLRSLGFTLPIIALTANAMESDRDACLAAGYTDYLSKPMHSHALIEVLRKHCQ